MSGWIQAAMQQNTISFRNGLSPPSENPSSLNHPAEQPLLPAASSTVQKNDGSPSTHNVSFQIFISIRITNEQYIFRFRSKVSQSI